MARRAFLGWGRRPLFEKRVPDSQKLLANRAFYHGYHVHQRSSGVFLRALRVLRGKIRIAWRQVSPGRGDAPGT